MIIGVDHGYGYIKTASELFVSGAKKYASEPAIMSGVVQYNGAFYAIGGNRQTVKDNKVNDDNYYVLTLAAVAKELKVKGLTRGNIILSVGLPLTQFGKEKDRFKSYLMREKEIYFRFDNISYNITIENVEIYPQGYAAIVKDIDQFVGTNILVDVGSWTVDILPIINKTPDQSRCASIDYGLITCMSKINEEFRRNFGGSIEENQIQDIMRGKEVIIHEKYVNVAQNIIKEYIIDLIAKIRELGFNMDVIPVIYMGGGVDIVKNFYDFNHDTTTFICDIHANAKGYEYISRQKQIKTNSLR